MKLRDKIDSIDGELAMLRKSVWFIMKKLEISPADIIKAEAQFKKEEEIAEIQDRARKLGLKVQ